MLTKRLQVESTKSDTPNAPPPPAKANGGDGPAVAMNTASPEADAQPNVPETAAAAPKQNEYRPPDDASDLSSLWLDPARGDGLVDTHLHDVKVGKPKGFFFRVNPDPAYRRITEIYVHKVEGMIDEQVFLIGPAMRGRFEEATLCTLVTVVDRNGTPRLWPLKLPKDGGRDNEAWASARSAAKAAFSKWVKLVWIGRAYQTREAQPGYAPDPDYSRLHTYDELVRIAIGERGIIRDEDHPMARELLGARSKGDGDDGLS
jgi:hypothetical protein